MKYFKYFSLFALTLILISCSKEKKTENQALETPGLIKVQTLENATHKIDLYSVRNGWVQGYNKVYFQIKDADNNLVENAEVSWLPVMHMMSMSHACPYSTVSYQDSPHRMYEGFLIFQMASNSDEYWTLTINYNVDGIDYTASDTIQVSPSSKQRVSSFQGSDGVRYVVALVAPSSPKMGVNDMEAMIYKMENMMTFSVVNGYTLTIDPRMTGMDNHGSPNNVPLTQSNPEESYFGKLSLTMTGYWKINMQLLNSEGEILKGEMITEDNESSTLYFEIDF